MVASGSNYGFYEGCSRELGKAYLTEGLFPGSGRQRHYSVICVRRASPGSGFFSSLLPPCLKGRSQTSQRGRDPTHDPKHCTSCRGARGIGPRCWGRRSRVPHRQPSLPPGDQGSPCSPSRDPCLAPSLGAPATRPVRGKTGTSSKLIARI